MVTKARMPHHQTVQYVHNSVRNRLFTRTIKILCTVHFIPRHLQSMHHKKKIVLPFSSRNRFDDYQKVTTFQFSFLCALFKRCCPIFADIQLIVHTQWINVCMVTTFSFSARSKLHCLQQFYCNAHKKKHLFSASLAVMPRVPAVLFQTNHFSYCEPFQFFFSFLILSITFSNYFQIISFSLFVFFILRKTMHTTTVPVTGFSHLFFFSYFFFHLLLFKVVWMPKECR